MCKYCRGTKDVVDPLTGDVKRCIACDVMKIPQVIDGVCYGVHAGGFHLTLPNGRTVDSINNPEYFLGEKYRLPNGVLKSCC